MITKKQIVKTTGTAAVALLISVAIPTQTFAASLTDQVGVGSSWFQSFFQKVWQQANGGQSNTDNTGDDNSENSDNNDNESPGDNSQTNPDQGSDEGSDQEQEDQSNDVLADRIISTGEKYMGTPYKFGAASGQTSTFDCSSFTQYVFKQHGISLPRSSRQQATVGKTVAKSQLQKGDLLFFTTSSSQGRIGHVGIYAGDNKILHTWGPGGVRYDSLSTNWLSKGYVTAKRVIN